MIRQASNDREMWVRLSGLSRACSKRDQPGAVDPTGSISKRGDARVSTLLCEAANVMLTRSVAPLKLTSRARAIGQPARA